jgi:hypothetical protein
MNEKTLQLEGQEKKKGKVEMKLIQCESNLLGRVKTTTSASILNGMLNVILSDKVLIYEIKDEIKKLA